MKAATGYRRAFDELVAKIQATLRAAPPGALPVRMYVAGGAAMHLLTGGRVTEDVDATFSQRLMLGDDVVSHYRDPDGRARVLYLDRNYNDSLGLMHENAYQDARPVKVHGVDAKVVEVRVLSPVDLAVTKLSRFSDQDREDILILARRGLVKSAALRKRASEALGGYVGNTAPVRTSMDVACRLMDAEAAAKSERKPRR